VILLDLAFPIGSLSLWSGISGPRHVVSLLSRAPSEIDLELIRNYAIQNVYGAYFIPGPTTLTDLSGVRFQALEEVLRTLRNENYTVILDLGRGTLPIMWRTLAACDWAAVITSANPTARALAKVAMQSLPEHGVDPRALLLLFNDVTDAKPADISMGLPRVPDLFIPHTDSFDELTDPSPFAHLWSLLSAREQATGA
jgi:MinD-like ATPase involved in chromosome partitioning or flagellar assembly